MLLIRADTFKISPQGKGTVYRENGGRKRFSKCWKSGNIIAIIQENRLLEVSGGANFLTGTRNGPAACMIIENHPPLPTRPRQNLNHDSTQQFLNYLVLPKHRTSKFSRFV